MIETIYNIQHFSNLCKKWWFFKFWLKNDDFFKFWQKLMIFQNSGKNDDFSKKNLKNYYFFKFCQKMMISQNTSKNDDFSNSCKKMMIFSNLLLKLFSKTLVSANLLVKWLMLYVAFNVSTYVVCWMFFVGFQCCDICRDIGQSNVPDTWKPNPKKIQKLDPTQTRNNANPPENQAGFTFTKLPILFAFFWEFFF